MSTEFGSSPETSPGCIPWQKSPNSVSLIGETNNSRSSNSKQVRVRKRKGLLSRPFAQCMDSVFLLSEFKLICQFIGGFREHTRTCNWIWMAKEETFSPNAALFFSRLIGLIGFFALFLLLPDDTEVDTLALHTHTLPLFPSRAIVSRVN